MNNKGLKLTNKSHINSYIQEKELKLLIIKSHDTST